MPAKSTLRDKNKKLTDFFAQRPSAAVPALATSSSLTGTTTRTTTMPTTRRRPATRASKATVDRDSSMNSSAPPQMRSASTMATRKRARSPDNNNPSTSLPPSKLKSPRKPMKTFQSDLDSERPTTVIYVTSPLTSRSSLAQRPTSAQVHNNTLVASPLDSSKQVVYSSQSDEVELVLPNPESRDLGKVVESVHTWRRKAFESSNSSAPRAREDAMEVNPLSSSPIRGSPVASAWGPSPHFDAPVRFAATSGSSVVVRTPIVASACLPSPSDTDELPPLPPTPEPIGPEAKAAKLIAEIKAKAFDANQSSDDERPLSFRELEDSDDGELIDDLPLISSAREQSSLLPAPRTASDVFSSPLSTVPSTFDDATIGLRTCRASDGSSPQLRPTRASARTRKPARAFHLPLTIAESSTSVSVTKSASFPSNRKKSQAMNPLHALLREKELEDKRGTSCAALRLAEEAIRQGSRETSVGSDDEFDAMNRLRLADEQAAWKAVHESRKSTSPVDPRDMEDFTIGDRESKMLGAVAGEAINKILAGDKNSKGKEKPQNMNQKMTLGVPLWTRPSDEDMDVDSISTPPLSGHPILTCLDGFLRSGDDSLLDLILRTGVLAAVPRDILLSNIPQLLNMALFASSQVADAVSIALRDLWGLNPHKVQMPLVAILFALVRLGASPSILEGLGLITERAEKNHISHETLLKALKRLLAVVKAAGFSGAFSSDDVANVVLILVIMGLDPLTSSELHTQLNITMDVVCNRGATDYLLHDIHEKVLSFARQLIPVNKARLVSFFASGSGWTRCIARRLAYCLLVSVSITPDDQVLPLEPLVLLLSPDTGSCELFDVTNESTDYEELRHHVNILSVALIDIAPYVEEERTIMKSASSTSVQGSPNKPKKPPAPPLELLRRVLEVLQSKIVDTRAAHLDRSRTKAAIQRLTMRIYYDRMALIGVRPRRRASTLKAYFSPQRQ